MIRSVKIKNCILSNLSINNNLKLYSYNEKRNDSKPKVISLNSLQNISNQKKKISILRLQNNIIDSIFGESDHYNGIEIY